MERRSWRRQGGGGVRNGGETTDFLVDPIATADRGACGSSAWELRLRRNKGPSCSVKLPLRGSLIASRREPNWTSISWVYPNIDQRTIYLTTVWAFDLWGRVSEYITCRTERRITVYERGIAHPNLSRTRRHTS